MAEQIAECLKEWVNNNNNNNNNNWNWFMN